MSVHPALAFDRESFNRTLQDRLASTEADLRDLEAMRTVIASPPPAIGHRTGKR